MLIQFGDHGGMSPLRIPDEDQTKVLAVIHDLRATRCHPGIPATTPGRAMTVQLVLFPDPKDQARVERERVVRERLAEYPYSTPSVRRRINKPWKTVDRQLQALHMLGITDVEEIPYGNSGEKSSWLYSLSADIKVDSIISTPESSPEMSVHTPSGLSVN
jgi:hypothetical protein